MYLLLQIITATYIHTYYIPLLIMDKLYTAVKKELHILSLQTDPKSLFPLFHLSQTDVYKGTPSILGKGKSCMAWHQV